METPLVISIISSATAIVIAILSIAFNSRNQKKTSIDLERFKMKIEIEKKQSEETLKLKREAIGAIDLALENTQKIKDSIQALTNYIQFNSDLTDEWLEKTRNEIHNYWDVFSIIFTKLDNIEIGILHDMKKHLQTVEFMISRTLYEKSPHEKKVNKNADKVRLTGAFLDSRERLSELQQSLLIRKANYNNNEEDSFNR